MRVLSAKDHAVIFTNARDRRIAMADENNASELKSGEPEDKPIEENAGERHRDAKGHFLPNPNGKSKRPHRKKHSLKRDLDENTVKIHILKEDKPLPPKDFEGKLEDEKERTAINFIRSIIANKPKRIDIDGVHYYSTAVVGLFAKAFEEERKLNNEATELISKVNAELKAANYNLTESKEIGQRLERAYDNLCFRKTCWKAVTLGLIIGTLLVQFCPIAYRYAKQKWFADKPVATEMQAGTTGVQGK